MERIRFRHSLTVRSRCGLASRSAFTLIELLVVVAIMSLLISILLPSLGAARNQSRQLLCLTNLRSQGEASRHYSQDNKEWFVRGLLGYPAKETHSYATSVVGYLGYEGDIRRLWKVTNQKKLIEVCRGIKQMQCPNHPVPDQVLDYVASACPIPYTVAQIQFDEQSGLDHGGFGGDGYTGQDAPDYSPEGRPDLFSGHENAARLIFVTEGHHNLAINELRYHHFFLTSQLPFGAFPRIANDQRHPGGLTALFFDGHARPMNLYKLDIGWPNSHGLRMRWFSDVPEPYN
jgi:prepilin-type N-terminal cleavage/methylation domain-containing protein/prepilin-type processing-associated H-X9-DG protein